MRIRKSGDDGPWNKINESPDLNITRCNNVSYIQRPI